MLELGITLTATGLLMELLLNRFRGFFDWNYVRSTPEPFKVVFSRVFLVVGVALLCGSGLVALA